jgi:hypothetical protein
MPSDIFDGRDVEPEDEPRLQTQLYCVYAIMYDGQWRTIWHIVAMLRQRIGIQVMQTSVSARLRDFRKPRFGAHIVEKLHTGQGEWHYRLILNKKGVR